MATFPPALAAGHLLEQASSHIEAAFHPGASDTGGQARAAGHLAAALAAWAEDATAGPPLAGGAAA